MAGDEIRRIRQQPGNEVSEGQVELLRAVRPELASQRGQEMLDIDGAQEDLRAALRECSQAPVRSALEPILAGLAQAHQQLAHIPEDVIPAF